MGSLCFQNLFGVNDVDVEQRIAGIQNTADHGAHLADALGVIGDAGVNLQLYRRRVAVAGLDHRNGIAHRGDGAVLAEAAIGVGAVIDRFAPLASVRGSLEQGTKQNGVGPGEKAGNKVAGVVAVLAVVFAVELFAGTIGGCGNGGLSGAALDLGDMKMK